MEKELTREWGCGTISKMVMHAHWQHGRVLTLLGCCLSVRHAYLVLLHFHALLRPPDIQLPFPSALS